MDPAPKLQLMLKDRLIQEVPFIADAMRIGRMKENDLCVNNLAVSRFHAVLHREGDVYRLEDLGSENGTWVNGVKVQGEVAVAPGDEITLGKQIGRAHV